MLFLESLADKQYKMSKISKDLRRLNLKYKSKVSLSFSDRFSCSAYDTSNQHIFIAIDDLTTLTYLELKWILFHEFGHSRQIIHRVFFLFINIFVFLFLTYLGHDLFLKNSWYFSVFLISYVFVIIHTARWFDRMMEYHADRFAHNHCGDSILSLFNKEVIREEKRPFNLNRLLFGGTHPTFKKRINYICELNKKVVS